MVRISPILRIGNDNAVRPVFLFFGDGNFHRFDGFDDIHADTFLDFQRNGRASVEPGNALCILEGAANIRDIAQCDNAVITDLDRNIENIGGCFIKPRNLDRKAALSRIHGACGNQLVVGDNNIDQIDIRNPVAFQLDGINDDFQDFFPVATDIRLQHALNPFDAIFQITCQPDQCALRNVTGKGDDNHRKESEIDFVDRWFFGFRGQFCLGHIHFFAHILKRLVHIEAGVEFHSDGSMAFRSGGGHFLHPFNGAQFELHRADQQPFRIFRGNPLMGHGNVNDRNIDIRIGFFRNINIGVSSCYQDQDKNGNDRSRPVDGRVDNRVHGRASET